MTVERIELFDVFLLTCYEKHIETQFQIKAVLEFDWHSVYYLSCYLRYL